MLVYGERILLRRVQKADFAKIVKWTNDPQVGHYMDDDGFPEKLADCEKWYEQIKKNRLNLTLMVVTFDGQVIGDIELDHITWRGGEAELRIRIGEDGFRGKGYGAEAITLLLAHAFSHMNLSEIYLRVAKGNLAAIRCYEKVGFKKEGRLVRSPSAPEKVREIYLMRLHKGAFIPKYLCSHKRVG